MQHEWNEILEWIAEESFSLATRTFIKHQPVLAQDKAEREFILIEEASTLEKSGVHIFNFDLDRLSDVLSRFRDNEPLEAIDYRHVGDFLEALRLAGAEIGRQTWVKQFDTLFEGFEFDISLEMVIKQTVDKKGQISSQASPELARIRKHLTETHQSIHGEIKKMIKDPTTEGMLQEDYFTVRDDRYVLPFKTQFKRAMKGVVHNLSRSGQTAFLEPLPLIEHNNRLAILAAREHEEIVKILRELRGLLHRKIAYVEQCFETALHLESLRVKSRWMHKYRCVIPDFVEERAVAEEAWYPPVYQRAKDATVRNSFTFKESERIMVVSGPNAGGKTVALKTFYTIAELARRGFPVPAKKAQIPYFTAIFMVLGDQQDASEGESSFSAHLRNLAEISHKAGAGSLVLIDEIGTGTDPQQGGAIARAYLEFVRETGAFAIVTSHLAEVKSLALEDSAFVPVAMGFDEKKDRPTYRFIYNLVGGSNALALVKKIDFPARFVRKLEKLLLARDESIEPLINRLKAKEAEIDEEKERIDAIKQEVVAQQEEIEVLKNRLAKKERDFEAERLKLLKKIAEMEETELKKRLEDFDVKQAAQRISVLKKEKEDIAQAINRQKAKNDTTEGTPLEDCLESIIPGETMVYDRLMKLKGTIASIKGKKAEINAGGKTITVPIERLIVLAEKAVRKVSSTKVQVSAAYNEKLDIRGMTADEAKDKVEKAVDTAFTGGSGMLIIVHGHGTGTLKKAIRDFLHTLVKRYPITSRPAPQEMGGDGTTLVEFK